MTTEWNEVLERLLSLQQLDSKIGRLQAELTRAPGDLKSREATVSGIDAKIKVLADRSKVLRAQILLRENEHKTHMSKIAKLKAQASEVRTNKEFVAFRSEIANAQGDCDRLQNEVLKILDVVEQADAKVAELESERQHETEQMEKIKAQMAEKLQNVQLDRDALASTRPDARTGIPKEQLELYEKIHSARGRAMSPLEGAYCSACGDAQTRNDMYAVQNRTRPVQCKGCNRILYQP